jgi:PAS domain S-box-containing protein
MNIGDQVLQTLMDAIPAPIFYKDSDLIYRGCNTAFLEFIGLPRDQALGKSVYGIAPRDLADVYHKADAELLLQGGVQIYEADVRYADRSHHRVEFRKAVFIDQETNKPGGMIGVMLDVTDLRATEAELIVAKDRAEDADRAKSRFLANISHELRTPLNAILSFSQIIGEERFGSIGNDRYVGYAHDIMRSGGSLLGLIDNILDLSRIEANQTELVLTAIDPISLARQCIDDIMVGGARSVNINLNDTSDSPLPAISTDEARLR